MKIEELEKKIENLQNNIKVKDSRYLNKEIEIRIETFESNMQILVKVIEEKDIMITAFEKKIKEVETIFKESIEGKDSEITKLEKKLEIQQNNSESILEKVDKFESFLKSSESKYKCKDCDFVSSTE